MEIHPQSYEFYSGHDFLSMLNRTVQSRRQFLTITEKIIELLKHSQKNIYIYMDCNL